MAYFLLALSGIMIIIPLHNPRLYFLAWVALIPALYALKQKSGQQSFLLAWIMGTIIMTGTGYWLYFPLKYHSDLSFIFIIIILIFLFISVGAIYGLWGLIYRLLAGKGVINTLFIALSWTGIEFLRNKLLPVFPFGFLGNTQTSFKTFLQLADIGGVFLLTFIVALFSGILYTFLMTGKKIYILMIIIILVLISGYGTYRLNYYRNQEFNKLKVGLVQSDIPQDQKWKNSKIIPGMNFFFNKAQEVQAADLIIFPESSFTFDMIAEKKYRRIFNDRIKEFNNYLQVGSLSIMNESEKKYNSVFLFSPDNKITGRYNKNKLVPFGEYMPFPELVETVTGMTMNSEQAGEKIVLFTTPFAVWRTVICSEILDTETIRQKINIADFIVNQSNEAWFGDTILHKQMWGAAILRAVESRRSVVRTGNHSINGVISPAGVSTLKTRPGDTGTHIIDIKKNREVTFYHKWGHLTGLLLFLFLISVLAGRIYIS